MRPFAGLLAISLVLLAGCQGPASPPQPAPPKPAPPSPPRAATEARPEQTAAERSTEYSKAHPWGEATGAARLTGTVTWAEGGGPPAPLPRQILVLKGLENTPSAGLYYRLRSNEQGEFAFDRIKGGQFRLSDEIMTEPHWRLRVEIREGEEMTLDLTPDNSIRVHDDFPPPKSN